jgi:hypothetical protein
VPKSKEVKRIEARQRFALKIKPEIDRFVQKFALAKELDREASFWFRDLIKNMQASGYYTFDEARRHLIDKLTNASSPGSWCSGHPAVCEPQHLHTPNIWKEKT